jgi:arylsulfatase A
MKLLLLHLAALLTSPLVAAATPNIVIIYADDLGYGDVQSNNPGRGKIPTPNIDRLAAEGMRFTDAHSSSAVCTPSRYALLTGRYHWRSSLQSGIVPPWGKPLIVPDRMTIGTLAQQHGYRTACIGKWHLGWDWPIPADRAALFKDGPKGEAVATDAHREVWREVFSQPIGGGPVTCGFDLYFGTDVPNWPPFCFIENDRTIGIPSEFLSGHLMVENQASQQGPALPGWTLEPVLNALADRAVTFIDEAAREKKPFLLYLPLTSPHTPLAPNEAWTGKSGLNTYADFVMETDDVVGRILDALRKSGVADNTMVIFTADNGCSPHAKIEELEAKGHYPSGPLRGAKSSAWEGGHRLPFVVCWPGTVPAGRVCDQLVHQTDLLRTFADVFGTALPDNAGEDSVSLLPLLKGGNTPVREHAVSTSGFGVPALRHGSWKYIAALGSGDYTDLANGNNKGISGPPVQLYDLSNDLGETNNLAAIQPAKLAEMRALLEQLIVEGRSTPGARQKNDVEVVRYPKAQAVPAEVIEE